MNEGGKRQAIDALEALEPQNSTNIWAGLEAGLESLRTARASPRRRAAAVPVADNYYAGNCGGCFSGECVVQCKEQDGMVREKQLSQVRSGDCLQVVDAAGHVGFSPVLCL
ncbi:unnamed protein product, partial [Rotaria sp. Silwood1]